jgi:LacI family transcriptional regulator
VKQDNPPPKSAKPIDTHKAANIDDVAAMAGVSIKTVSRVLNGQPGASKATREAVQKAVAALSYRPNVFARGLASKRSILIGLLYDKPAMGSNYFTALQLGALSRCHELGYHLIVESFDAQDPTLSGRIHSLATGSALSGVILAPPLCDMPAVLDVLAKSRTPIVRIGPKMHVPGSFDVKIDDRKAAFDITTYLIGLGHKRIGFIKGKPDHSAAQLRFEGYRAALARAGLPLVEELCVQGYFTYQSGIKAGEQLLSQKPRPTAIFAGNDDMAAAVLAVSLRYNLKIPQHLSLVGFDDSQFAQAVWPRLTTCRQPISEMAEEAISILVSNSQGKGAFEKTFTHELVVRESTAPPEA